MIYKRRVSDRKYVGNKPPELPALKYQPMEMFDKPRKQAVCDCCTTTRALEEFPYVSDPDIYHTGENGRKRATFCTYCCVKFCERMEEKYGSQYKALYRLCAFIGLYYDDALAHRVWEEDREDDPRLERKSFMDEGDVPFEYIIQKQRNLSITEELSEQGRRDRQEIIEKFHYDPFEKEPAKDRGRLYADLVTLYDDAMATDLTRQRAAIEVVKSFYRIDSIGQTIQELQASPQSMVDNANILKNLIEQKAKETAMVDSFSKAHGFAERYQNGGKTKGAGTLSSVVRDGFDNHFDKLAVNKFDIETSNAMRQVADISAASMMNQIQLSSDDFRKMVEEQAEKIRELTAQVAELAEANRLFKEKEIKQQLMDEYVEDLKAKGIADEVVKEAVKKAQTKTYYPKNGLTDGDE